MTKLVRLMLVWLMLLAIPFQGIASAAMLSCAHDAAHDAAQVHAPAADAAPAGHCHDNAPQATPSMHHADAGSHDASSHDHDGRCSACAACCMGAAIAPLPAIAAAPPAAMLLHVASASQRLPAVDLALPERPPRPSLA